MYLPPCTYRLSKPLKHKSTNVFLKCSNCQHFLHWTAIGTKMTAVSAVYANMSTVRLEIWSVAEALNVGTFFS